MERIKQALERARAEREGHPIPAATTVARTVSVATPVADTHTPAEQVTYSQTRHVDVSANELKEKRVISALEHSAFTDAYKMLRTQVLQRLNENDWNVLAVTSPGTGEGKSLTALNLAISMAMEIGHTVLLVELDDHLDRLDDSMYELLDSWEKPVLFNDSLATEASLSQPNRLDYGRKLSEKLFSLLPQAPQSVA